MNQLLLKNFMNSKNNELKIQLKAEKKRLIVFNKKNNIVLGKNGTGKSEFSKDVINIFSEINSYFPISLRVMKQGITEKLIVDKFTNNLTSIQWIASFNELNLVKSMWTYKNLTINLISKYDEKKKTYTPVFNINTDGVYLQSHNHHLDTQLSMSKEDVDKKWEKIKYYLENVATIEWLKLMIDGKTEFIKNEIQKWNKIFKEGSTFDMFGKNQGISAFRQFNEYGSHNNHIYNLNLKDVLKYIGTNISQKEKLVKILHMNFLPFYKKNLISEMVDKISDDEIIPVIMYINYVDNYFRTVYKNKTAIYSQQIISNVITWLPGSNGEDFRFSGKDTLTGQLLSAIYNKTINDEISKKHPQYIQSANAHIDIMKKRDYSNANEAAFEYVFNIRKRLIAWLGFSDKVSLLENGSIKFKNGSNRLSTGWNNILNKVLVPLSKYEIKDAEHLFLIFDDLSDSIDDSNIVSILSAVKNLNKIIENKNIKTVCLTHNLLFLKRWLSAYNQKTVIQFIRNFETDIFDNVVIPKFHVHDNISHAYFWIIKNTGNKDSHINMMNSARIISDWIMNIYGEEKFQSVFGDEIFSFCKGALNLYSHDSEMITDLSDENKILFNEFIEKAALEFPNKFKNA